MEYNITSRTITDEAGRSRRYHYSLLVEQIEGAHFACENYGVCIREDGGERVCVPGVTTSAMRVDELMSLLIEHRVTPAALVDVVADWL